MLCLIDYHRLLAAWALFCRIINQSAKSGQAVRKTISQSWALSNYLGGQLHFSMVAFKHEVKLNYLGDQLTQILFLFFGQTESRISKKFRQTCINYFLPKLLVTYGMPKNLHVPNVKQPTFLKISTLLVAVFCNIFVVKLAELIGSLGPQSPGVVTQTNNYRGLVQILHKGIDYVHMIIHII